MYSSKRAQEIADPNPCMHTSTSAIFHGAWSPRRRMVSCSLCNPGFFPGWAPTCRNFWTPRDHWNLSLLVVMPTHLLEDSRASSAVKTYVWRKKHAKRQVVAVSGDIVRKVGYVRIRCDKIHFYTKRFVFISSYFFLFGGWNK